MVKHWLPEGYEFLSNLILPFVVGAEELWRAHKNARGAREDTRAVGYLGNREWKACGNRGSNVFLNAVEFSEAHYLLGFLDATFIVL